MDAGPDAPRSHESRLGAFPAADADLGPISPELALVDPELARRARELLPEPQERPRRPRPRPRPEPAAPERAAQPEVERRSRRWPRAIALAIVIFAAGAVSGSLLGNHQTGSPATTLGIHAAAPTTRESTTGRPALRPPAARPARQAASAPLRRQRRRHARVVWASNVLGVEATVSRRGVALQWQRPADSARVVVLRKRGASSAVVYRGRATSYRDSPPRSCTGYRYTIVNYDRRGHRSTGVPTSVVTLCA